MINNKIKLKVIDKATFCRAFEEETFRNIKKKNIKIPVYLSAGQELIPSTLSEICKIKKVKPLLFGQHRCHSIYLAFGGNPAKLVRELMSKKDGCTWGKGGSASIHSMKINMYGHDGLMGSNGPVGVGACFATGKPTIIFLGDAAAEEDYVLGAMGWASKKKLPIVFIIEDNNLSILTEKNVRRNWEISDVAKSFKMESYNINDAPQNIFKVSKNFFKKPILVNINTNRLFWHAGAGQDDPETLDRLKLEIKKFGKRAILINKKNKMKVNKLWQKQLERP